MADGILLKRIVLNGLGHWNCLVTIALSSLVVEGTLLESIVLSPLGHWDCLVAIALARLRAVSGASHLKEPLSILFFVERHFEVGSVVQEGLGQ